MTLDDIYANLCAYDKRNPCYYYDPEFMDEPKPRDNCFCDSCFRGTDKLALEILKLRDDVVSAKQEGSDYSEHQPN